MSSIATNDERKILGTKLRVLEAAARMPHNNSSLLGHLIGVWRVLRAGGADAYVADAGLIHSVYATQYFHLALFADSQRMHLSDTFGQHSEALAWLFCQIDREDLARQRPSSGFVEAIVVQDHKSNTAINIGPEVANDLFMLECANFIDQGYRGRSIGAYHAWGIRLSERGVGLNFKLPPSHEQFEERSEVEAISLYSAVANGKGDSNSLQRAAALDPLSAEPLLLLAAAAASDGRYDDGQRALEGALERLPLFGSSWDKRLAWPEWWAIAEALQLAIRSQVRPEFLVCNTDPAILLNWSKIVA